ncbi:MAG: hypothetical protein SH821_03945 [Phototrophicales bacterium]|nr:hypothetical protein [Phototrophicales bacterium]
MKQWLIVTFLIGAMAFIIAPNTAQTTPNYTCPIGFTGFLSPRLTDSPSARVIVNNTINLRPIPSTSQARLTAIPQWTTLPLIDTLPQCNEGYVWWNVTYGDFVGWLAEGSGEDYWLEARGALISENGYDDIPRWFVELPDGTTEPEGCLRPPDDYTQVNWDYITLNQRTLFMLDNAQRIYREWGGIVNFRTALVQGSYNAGVVAASFGTHDGGGAADISVRSPIDFSLLTAEMPYMIEALRIAGFAAWVRRTGELYDNSPIHIHAIAVGDTDLSEAARAQIDSERGYLYGYNGLPESYGTLPISDSHGGPIICAWMLADGFPDLRDIEDTEG